MDKNLSSPWNWTAVRQDPPILSQEWVSLADRLALNLSTCRFDEDQLVAPSWLCAERLEHCSTLIARQVQYQAGTGFPAQASMGNHEALIARDYLIDHYGYQLEAHEILGFHEPGARFLGMAAPCKKTVCPSHRFFRIILEQQVGLLVRLTDWEGADYWTSPYWSDHRPSKLLELAYEDWPDNGMPPDGRFFEIVLEIDPLVQACAHRREPVVIHCNAGIGRTGTLAAALMLKMQMDRGEQPDPWGVVLEMRKRRQCVVYTFCQFLALYRFANWYLTC